MHVVAIIQARMESTRLPGKVLLSITGKPLLWHIIYRLRKSRTVDQICLAIPDTKPNDVLADFGEEQGIEVFRGSEENVLERYYLAAQKMNADIVIRVNGDAPLIDPQWLDYLVNVLIKERVDIALSDPETASVHQGFTPVSFRALEKLATEAAYDPVAREHVTSYLEKNPDFVFSKTVIPWPQHRFQGARLSIDTPSDLNFMEEVYSRLQAEAGEVDLADLVELLKREPELLQINAHVYQKGADIKAKKVLFRCDGDEQIGFGHITRCLALAEVLRDNYGCGVTFAIASGKPGIDMIRKAGYHLEIKESLPEASWQEEVISRLRPDAAVFDYRGPADLNKIDEWRKEGILIASIDDPTEKRLHADMNFYPPIPQFKEMNWDGFQGELYIGWQWVILRNQFAGLHKLWINRKKKRPELLITMGGSDPHNLTLMILKAVDILEDQFDTSVLLGPGFKHHQSIEKFIRNSRREYQLLGDVRDVGSLFVRADLAAASFGVTAYELAAAGVPSVLIGISEDHVSSASTFEKAGIGFNLGLYSNVTEEKIKEAIFSLLEDSQLRQVMSQRAGELVDGKGAERIAALIYNRLCEKVKSN